MSPRQIDRRRTRKATTRHRLGPETDDDSNHNNDEDHQDDNTTKTTTTTPLRQRRISTESLSQLPPSSTRTRKSRRRMAPYDAYDSAEEDSKPRGRPARSDDRSNSKEASVANSSAEEDEALLATKPPPSKRPRRRRGAHRTAPDDRDEALADSSSDDEEVPTTTTQQSSRYTSPSPSKTVTQSPPTRTPRASAQKARANFLQQLQQQQQALDDEITMDAQSDGGGDADKSLFVTASTTRRRRQPPRRAMRKARPPRRSKVDDDDDEEFQWDDASSSNDDDSLSNDDHDSDEEEALVDSDQEVIHGNDDSAEDDYDETKVGHVRDEDIGSAEEEEDDEQNARPMASPRLQLHHESPAWAARRTFTALDDWEESSDDEDGVSSPQKRPSFEPTLPDCPSTNDAVTAEALPRKHVCFISPDGTSRQCFALSTLHKIATSTVCQQIRQDHLTGRMEQTFLQPPHFRSKMSDDLLDQIASRFGRDALQLGGEFYKRSKTTHSENTDNEEEVVFDSDDDDDDDDDDEAFAKQVQNYVRDIMGSKDLYVCPLCYVVARRKYRLHKKLNVTAEATKTDDELYELYVESHGSDPMEVMRYIDRNYVDSFTLSSSFCFPRASQVKQHIRDDHGLPTRHVDGNDLYLSFKVRETDGLLQRFLKAKFRGHVNQGAMMRYWFAGGNRFDFLYLYSLVEEAAVHRSLPAGDESDSDDDQEIAQAFMAKARQFFDSFDVLAKRLWHMLSEPYRRASRNEMKEFIDDDDHGDQIYGDGEDEANLHRQLDQKMNAERNQGLLTQEEQDLIAFYEQKDANELADYEEDEPEEYASEEEEEEDDDDEKHVLEDSESEASAGGIGSSEEEVDEWEQAIQSKRKAKAHKGQTLRRPARLRGRTEKVEKAPSVAVPASASRKRLYIMDSDEE